MDSNQVLAVILIILVIYYYNKGGKDGMLERPFMAEFLSLPDNISSPVVYPPLKKWPVEGNYAPAEFVWNTTDFSDGKSPSYIFGNNCVKSYVY
jgi:hypothetical protein